MRKYRIRKFPARLLLVIVIIAIIAFNPKIFLSLRGFAFNTLAKPFKFLTSIKTHFTKINELSEKNLRLKQRLATLSVLLARLDDTAYENKRLQALLDFKRNVRFKSVAAKVIGRDSTDWRKSIIINKGKKDGIRQRMPCATAKGFIGSVVEVGSSSSKVILINDPNSKVGVILESSRESGVLIGSPQGSCKVIYLSVDAKIDKGEKILTAGFSTFFPKGLLIGEVISTGVEKTKLYKYAIVDLFEDMNKIEEIICIDTLGHEKY
ncbi:MAG: rod shape-determining protein MreC [Candidatus Omnitrophica bacterium]|nr:rod shape-determining protein MreC [Candidatus Omnitrophota bacterium]